MCNWGELIKNTVEYFFFAFLSFLATAQICIDMIFFSEKMYNRIVQCSIFYHCEQGTELPPGPDHHSVNILAISPAFFVLLLP